MKNTYMYNKDGSAALFTEDEAAALDTDWADTPAAFDEDTLENAHKENTEEKPKKAPKAKA